MSLTAGVPRTSQQAAKGIFISEATIKAVRDVSGKEPYKFEFYTKGLSAEAIAKLPERIKTPCDCGIQMKLDIGKSFEPEMLVYGNFKWNGNVVADWGGAFKVRTVFDVTHVPMTMNGTNKLPETAIKQLVGKKVLRLSYIRGVKQTETGKKMSTLTWDIVGDATDPKGKEKLLATFQAYVKKQAAAGYPLKFNPDAMDELNSDAASFTPAAEGQSTVATQVAGPPEDDNGGWQ
jgi:hypothetical protein